MYKGDSLYCLLCSWVSLSSVLRSPFRCFNPIKILSFIYPPCSVLLSQGDKTAATPWFCCRRRVWFIQNFQGESFIRETMFIFLMLVTIYAIVLSLWFFSTLSIYSHTNRKMTELRNSENGNVKEKVK